MPRRDDLEVPEEPVPDIMELIARAPWREAVTYRDTWPHEYVVVKEDGQQALLAAFCARIARGEGVEGRLRASSGPRAARRRTRHRLKFLSTSSPTIRLEQGMNSAGPPLTPRPLHRLR